MSKHFRLLLLCICLLATALAGGAQTAEVDIGGIVLSVSDSWTAQVFHIVDQLSEWDDACHRQYGRWAAKALTLDGEDRELLRKHGVLRRARGWNKGFEEAFYVDDPIEAAADKAVEKGLLSRDEAAAEKLILLHFAPKLSVLRDAPQIARFKDRLAAEAKRLAPTVQKLVRFSEIEDTVKLPLFLIINPEEGNAGGGFNGGRLVLEIQDRPDPVPTLFHECFHALLWRHKETIEAAAQSAGIRFGALNEGIAYAFGPGLTDNILESDTIAQSLARALRNREKAWPDAYVQAWAVALVIRPVLRAALDRDETFTSFLPKALAEWRTAVGP